MTLLDDTTSWISTIFGKDYDNLRLLDEIHHPKEKKKPVPLCKIIVDDIENNGASTPEEVHKRTGIGYENCKKYMTALKFKKFQSERLRNMQQTYGLLYDTGETRITTRNQPASVVDISIRGNYGK